MEIEEIVNEILRSKELNSVSHFDSYEIEILNTKDKVVVNYGLTILTPLLVQLSGSFTTRRGKAFLMESPSYFNLVFELAVFFPRHNPPLLG